MCASPTPAPPSSIKEQPTFAIAAPQPVTVDESPCEEEGSEDENKEKEDKK